MEANLNASKQIEIYLADKLSLSEIARRLNKVGFTTTRGKAFTAQSVKNLIKQFEMEVKQ